MSLSWARNSSNEDRRLLFLASKLLILVLERSNAFRVSCLKLNSSSLAVGFLPGHFELVLQVVRTTHLSVQHPDNGIQGTLARLLNRG